MAELTKEKLASYFIRQVKFMQDNGIEVDTSNVCVIFLYKRVCNFINNGDIIMEPLAGKFVNDDVPVWVMPSEQFYNDYISPHIDVNNIENNT